MRGTVNSRRARAWACRPRRARRSSSAEQAGERLAQRERVARRHDEAGLPVEVGVGDAGGQVGGHHRRARGVGLDLHQAEGLAAGHAGQAEDVGGVVPGAELFVVERRQEGHAAGERRSPRPPAQPLFQRAASHEHQVGVHTGHGPQQDIDALVVDQPADEQHDLAALMPARAAALRAALCAAWPPAARGADRTAPPGTSRRAAPGTPSGRPCWATRSR